mmetsp:Transcript_55566/g.116267  ORF Transcript_55566/g.116267 Transcript_55566/m.116267 type:complete len:101 (-) Transcript_55566:31-333(-)
MYGSRLAVKQPGGRTKHSRLHSSGSTRLTGFRGQHFAIPAGDSSPLDIPRPDPNDYEDMDVPDQEALMDAFMAGLAKESDSDFRSLSQLLATLPQPTQRC